MQRLDVHVALAESVVRAAFRPGRFGPEHFAKTFHQDILLNARKPRKATCGSLQRSSNLHFMNAAEMNAAEPSAASDRQGICIHGDPEKPLLIPWLPRKASTVHE